LDDECVTSAEAFTGPTFGMAALIDGSASRS